MSGRHALLLVVLAASSTLIAGQVHPQTPVPQMIPLNDGRNLGAMSDYMGFHSEDARSPAGFNPWTPEETEAIAEEVHDCPDDPGELCSYGYGKAYAFQFSQFFGQAVQFNGSSQCGWVGQPSGTSSAHSLASFRFRMDVPFTYRLFARLTPGDTPGYVDVQGPTPDVIYFNTSGGALPDSGQLGPGEYVLEGYSGVGPTSEEDVQGATYSLQWEVDPYIYRALGLQPGDQTVACGGTATFTVGTIGSPAGVTFQWRRNLAPLTNSSHIAGATASTLVINGACSSDAGMYDVVVTSPASPGGPAVEVSRQALLNIATVASVSAPAPAPPAFTVSPAMPNPFARETKVRLETSGPTRVTLSVYNVAGARVRQLLDQVVSGAGSATWDGTTRSGARAPAGIYYLRADAGAWHEQRKIVLLR